MFVFVLAGIVYNVWKRRNLLRSAQEWPGSVALARVPGLAIGVIAKEVMLQKSIFDCGKRFWVTHFTLFWGFIGAGITTTLVYLFHPNGIALALNDPIKILGNSSAVLLIIGGTLASEKRLRDTFSRQNTLSYDAIFLLLLYGTAVTGFLTEMARLSEIQFLAYSIYAVHLGFVILLLGLAPWTKFAHAIYRPVVSFLDKITWMRRTSE